MGCEVLKGNRFAKLSLAAAGVLLGRVRAAVCLDCTAGGLEGAGVDRPDMGGVGRRAG